MCWQEEPPDAGKPFMPRLAILPRRCSCGEGFDRSEFPRLSEGKCSIACSGDKTQRCGAYGVSSVYRYIV